MEPRTVRLRLRVSPGASRAAVVGRHGDAWKVRVTSAPERGRANADVIDLIAGALGVVRAAVRVVAGASSRDKVVELSGISLAEAERRLDSVARPNAVGKEHA